MKTSKEGNVGVSGETIIWIAVVILAVYGCYKYMSETEESKTVVTRAMQDGIVSNDTDIEEMKVNYEKLLAEVERLATQQSNAAEKVEKTWNKARANETHVGSIQKTLNEGYIDRAALKREVAQELRAEIHSQMEGARGTMRLEIGKILKDIPIKVQHEYAPTSAVVHVKNVRKKDGSYEKLIRKRWRPSKESATKKFKKKRAKAPVRPAVVSNP